MTIRNRSALRFHHCFLAALVVFAPLAPGAHAAENSTVRSTLSNSGYDADASGTIRTAFKAKAATFRLDAAWLTPGQSYTLTVAGISQGSLLADAKGKVSVTFVTPANRSKPVLDFDPRGQVVELLQGTNLVLSGICSGAGESQGSMVTEQTDLRRLAGAGQAEAKYSAVTTGRRMFSVKLSGVSGTNWTVYVGGLWRGDVSVRNGKGTITFDSMAGTTGRPGLDFDARDEVIDLALGTDVMFTGKLRARIANVNVATPSRQFFGIPSTGADGDAAARARLRVDADARRKFKVELQNLPVGDYEFVADGVLQGLVQSREATVGTQGDIEFSSRPDDSHELPLTFDPTNATFTVQAAGVAYFQGRLAGLNGGGSNEPPTQIEETLSPTGLNGAAHGSAKYEIDDRSRRKFSVEIEAVPAAAYELWVAGVKRATFNAILSNDQVKGGVEFSSPIEAGKLGLNFDPRGQLLEVRNSAGIYFSHLFGTGDGSGTNAQPTFEIALPLFSTGLTSNAVARIQYRHDEDRGNSFEVEIEDAPLGSYSLRVGGTVRGTLEVLAASGGTRGQVEFDDSPESGQQLLDFDPLGQQIELERDGVIYFARALPAHP